MIGALWNGVSGIINYDTGIAVESNNIANTSTTAYKQNEVSFQDLLYSNGGYGKGVMTQGLSKQFGQGNINQTGATLDMAIDGKGFFILGDKDGGTFYTRAGDFKQTKDGFLETQDGMRVLGLVPQNRLISSTNPQDTMFTTEFSKNIVSMNLNAGNGTVNNINAKTTDYTKTATDDDISQKGNNYKTAQAKINDINALIDDYLNKLNIYDGSQASVASVSQISNVDFSSQLSNITDVGNSISITIDGKTFNIAFDNDGIASDQDIQDFYNSLDQEARILYGLSDPSTIPTQEQIDAMPTTTPQEIAAKDVVQQQRDSALMTYDRAINLVSAYKDLADKISNTAGYTASMNNGVLTVESLIAGKSFSITDVSVNGNAIDSTTTQEAVAGSGLAMVESAQNALKSAIESVNGKFLEITNSMQYADLGTYGTNELNLRLDVLGLVEDELGEVSVSDDGFIFVKSGDNKFLVGRVATVSFRNEQGLEAVGDNKFITTASSGIAYNADTMGTIKERSLERSNTTFATALTTLMIYQRAYEASSKSITTADEFLQTAIEMVQ